MRPPLGCIRTIFCIDNGITFGILTSMKTAISIPDKLFKEVDNFAEEHNYSRSEVFALAVREFFEKAKSQRLLDALNKAYSEEENSEEKEVREKSKGHYSKKIMKEPF